MKTENVLYTDGHDVTVTESMFQVKKKWYNLSGITKHGFSILQPDRVPCILLLLAGVALEVIGSAGLIPTNWVPSVYLFNIWFNVNQIAIGLGLFFLVVGAAWLWLTKERYAVSITTAEGERNVIVSKRKEYITQIVHALNEAFFARIPSNGDASKTRIRRFTVSGR